MHEAITERYVTDYLPALRAAKDEAGQKGVLRLLVLAVERDTRQAAMRLSQDLTAAIDEMHDKPPSAG